MDRVCTASGCSKQKVCLVTTITITTTTNIMIVTIITMSKLNYGKVITNGVVDFIFIFLQIKKNFIPKFNLF